MAIQGSGGFYLGKKDPVPSPFREFKNYFATPLPAPPPTAHYGGRVTVPWEMLGNGPDPEVTIAPPGWSGCGDCVEASKVHALITGNYDADGKTEPIPTADATIENYAAYQGCTPAELFADPSQYDNGEDMTTSYTGWCKTEQYGLKAAFTATVNHESKTDLMNGIYLGGGLGVGIQIQAAQQTQFPNVWSWVQGSPIEGGHAIWLTGYNADYVYLVTWGQLIAATWDFILQAADEAHVLLLPQAVAAGKTPSGLLIPQWESELASLD